MRWEGKAAILKRGGVEKERLDLRERDERSAVISSSGELRVVCRSASFAPS